MPQMKGQAMLQCMHALEAAGRTFGAKKLRDLSELGELHSALAAAISILQHNCLLRQTSNSLLTQQHSGEQFL